MSRQFLNVNYIEEINTIDEQREIITKDFKTKLATFGFLGNIDDPEFCKSHHLNDSQVELLKQLITECSNLNNEIQEKKDVLKQYFFNVQDKVPRDLKSSTRVLKMENMSLQKKIKDLEEKIEKTKQKYLRISPFKKVTEEQKNALNLLDRQLNESTGYSIIDSETESSSFNDLHRVSISFTEFIVLLRQIKKDYEDNLKRLNESAERALLMRQIALDALIKSIRVEHQKRDQDIIHEYEQAIHDNDCMIQGYIRAYKCYMSATKYDREKLLQQLDEADQVIDDLLRQIEQAKMNRNE